VPKGIFMKSMESKGEMCFAPANRAHSEVWVAPVSRERAHPLGRGSAPNRLHLAGAGDAAHPHHWPLHPALPTPPQSSDLLLLRDCGVPPMLSFHEN